MRTTLTALCVTVLLTGCVTLQREPGAHGVRRSYEVGSTHTAAIGDPIFQVQNGLSYEAYQVTRDYQPPQGDSWRGGYNFPPMRRGQLFGVIWRSSEGILGLESDEYKAPISALPSSVVKTTIWITPDGTVTPKIAGPTWTDAAQLFAPSTERYFAGGSFKAEMIYSGLIGNTVKAVYREYSNDLARAAFTTELQYNLDESRTIAYKSVKIEVLQATNQSITYKVIGDEGLPWLP